MHRFFTIAVSVLALASAASSRDDHGVKPREPAYAWNGTTAIAYQSVSSTGPPLLFVPGSVTHIEMLWRYPPASRFLTRVAGFCRLILMDPRGLGLSDRLAEVPMLEDRVGDILAVLDATDTDRATLFGNADTGPACIATAALHSDRVAGLVLCGTYARASWSEDYPIGATEEEWANLEEHLRQDWGSVTAEVGSPRELEPAFHEWWTSMMRVGASPRAVLLLAEMTRAVDVRPLLARISAPTLVMHRVNERVNSVEHGRYLADHIEGARWVGLGGDEFALWAGDLDAIANEIEEFMTGRREAAQSARVVATVMFTDVARSTERANEMGDRAWSDLLEIHHSRVRLELARFGGREIDTAGDGFFVSFETPSAAISCARAVIAALSEIGVDLRIGIHTGECEVVGDSLRGLAVHVGARVGEAATAGEILVSQTVRDLLIGSGIELRDQGIRKLKGVPGEWRLYEVSPLAGG